MISRRTSKGHTEQVRPSFTHSGPNANGNFEFLQVISQLVDDIRDILEQLRDKQMLQSDVRDDIRKMRRALERIAGG